MRPLGDEAVPTTSSTTTTADTGTDPSAASTTSTTVHPTPETPPAAPVASDPDRYTVSPGECLWSRSEEHTSELQSLMRISYAVFCLKKKKKQELTIQHI